MTDLVKTPDELMEEIGSVMDEIEWLRLALERSARRLSGLLEAHGLTGLPIRRRPYRGDARP